jgi:hypothetical protein
MIESKKLLDRTDDFMELLFSFKTKMGNHDDTEARKRNELLRNLDIRDFQKCDDPPPSGDGSIFSETLWFILTHGFAFDLPCVL